MSECVFKGAIDPGTITAELDSEVGNTDADQLVALYSALAGGATDVDEDTTPPGGSARVRVEAGGRGILEVWVAIGAEADRGTLRVLSDGELRHESEIQGSVRWVYSVQPAG